VVSMGRQGLPPNNFKQGNTARNKKGATSGRGRNRKDDTRSRVNSKQKPLKVKSYRRFGKGGCQEKKEKRIRRRRSKRKGTKIMKKTLLGKKGKGR